MDDDGEFVPVVAPAIDLRQQLLELGRRGHVFSCLLRLTEAPAACLPADELAHGVADLLGDERLDNGLVDEAHVDEQLAESPALQVVSLRVEGLGQRLGCQRVGRDEPRAERRPLAGHLNGVDEAGFDEDECFLAGHVDDMEATGHRFGGEVAERGRQGNGLQVALEHCDLHPMSIPPSAPLASATGRKVLSASARATGRMCLPFSIARRRARHED